MYIVASFFLGMVSFCCVVSFLVKRYYLLISLLILEAIVLIIIFIFLLQCCELEIFIIFLILSFGACEASLGLACLVIMVRSYGRDIFKSFRNYKC